MRTHMRYTTFSIFLVALFAGACSPSNRRDQSRPFVGNVRMLSSHALDRVSRGHDEAFARADRRAADVGVSAASRAVGAEVTMSKTAVFGREFLYGFDLQYSSDADETYGLILQTEALGHVPAFFRRQGSQVQLVADQSRLYESVNNHPEVLIATYDITREDADTITLTFATGGLVLNEVVNGKGSPAPLQTWIRSLESVEGGTILLQESALLLADGNVETFMESLFPRDRLVPAGYVPLEANADNEPLAARYRFLSPEKVFVPKTVAGRTVRVETSFAARFHVPESGTIDWYVTPNIADEFLGVMKSGVEGWNRYFEAQMGRPVLRFMGRLPSHIKLGDPRYNVINFDSVAEAGAAYESQAADPLTGIQSHSLIYMPFAWYNIGIELWRNRTDVEAMAPRPRLSALQSPEVLFGKDHHILACERHPDEVSFPATILKELATQSGPGDLPASLDEFGKRLMIAVLMHEVGHALGLDHNFKGSLAFDGSRPSGPDNPTSWSIMDYNYYQAEMDLFDEIGGTTGPSMEYDRQIISQLYNGGRDVQESDLVVPACNDDETDAKTGGMDPLCVRYDSEAEPINGVAHAWHNLTAPSGGLGSEPKTLAEMVSEVAPEIAANFADSLRTPDVATMRQVAEDAGVRLGQVARYFITVGAQSLRVNVRNNARALRVWQDGSGLNEILSRQRYSAIFDDTFRLRSLPAAPQSSVDRLFEQVAAAVRQNGSLGSTENERMQNAEIAVTILRDKLAATVAAALTSLRANIVPHIAYDAANPMALVLGPSGGLSGFEDSSVAYLAGGAKAGLDATTSDLISQHATEREASAKALRTYADAYPEVVAQTTGEIQELIASARNAGNVHAVTAGRAILRIMQGG